ncbi:MAG TPA: hypothetical protein VIB11_14115 [Pedococcus sp.]|uniref:hypothetical protein n=1 Tax=Pedococcus sp. TaxID=2860345 RepID=UPI002F95E914
MSNQYPPPPPPPGESGYPGMPGGPGAGPMPQAPPVPGAPAPASKPSSIVQAVRLMYLGAVLTVLGGLLTPLIRDDLRGSMEEAMAGQPTPMTADQLDTIVTVIVAVSVVFGFIWAGVWLLMAWVIGKGKSWGRVVATVLFALNLVSFLAGIAQGQATGVVLVVNLLTLLVGGFVVALLWRKDSSAYIAAASAPRY